MNRSIFLALAMSACARSSLTDDLGTSVNAEVPEAGRPEPSSDGGWVPVDAGVALGSSMDAGRAPDAAIMRMDATVVDASVPQDAGASVTRDGGPPDAGPMRQDGGTRCVPARAPATCDPVRNTGCPPVPLMQCDVDPEASAPTGRCVIFTPTPIVPCTSTTTVGSTACLPTTTCVGGQCRDLCDCDADCNAGQCCNEPTGAFKLCSPC